MFPIATTDELERMRDVSDRVQLSVATIARMRKAGTFPNPVRVGSTGRSLRWRKSDVSEWIASRTAAHDAPSGLSGIR